MAKHTLSKAENIQDVFTSQDNIASTLKTLKLMQKNWRSSKGKMYNILKYDKSWLSLDLYECSGLFRSVITGDKKILSYSPPKSLNVDRFMKKYGDDKLVAEEFVEGTMVNLFFDERIGENGDWEIATRSTVGANVSFFTAGKSKKEDTFRYMFLEVCDKVKLDFDKLPKEYCYSFVLQHPKNRIVSPITEEALFLIAIYKCDTEKLEVDELPRDVVDWTETDIKMPEQYGTEDIDAVIDKYASTNTSYEKVGVIIKHESGARCKYRNPNYENVRQLRGNQPKLQYQYLSLRQEGKVKEFLDYFPEKKEDFNNFRTQMHDFTNTLHSNYHRCYVKKEKVLTEFPYQFRTHMYRLHHEIYLAELREEKSYISRHVVINYINKLHPAQQMHSLNFHVRQRDNDVQKKEVEAEN